MPYEIKKGAGKCKPGQWAVVKKGTDTSVGCHDTEKSAKKHLAALYTNVVKKEAAPVPVNLHESTTLAEAAAAGQAPSGRMAIQIITPGWGSSGYYAPEVLEAAAGAKLITKGTPMFLDHPTESAASETGGVRSVRDMAAVFTEDARWTGDALVAEAQVFSPYRPLLTEMADHIGVSIRGSGELSEGEVEGRRGPVIESLDAIASVDFVTAAGRGGKVLELLESARVSEASESDTRDALRAAVNDAHAGDDRSYAYVRDYDPDASLVWFECSGLQSNLNGLFQQSYSTGSNGSITLAGTPVEVRVKTTYVPVNPAGQSTPQESEEDTMPNIEEARLAQLEEAHGRVPVLEGERDTAIRERDAVARELAAERARGAAQTRARRRITEANSGLAAVTVDRIVAEATRTVPLIKDGERAGQLDEAAFDTATDQARTAEETYLAGLAEQAGAGTITGFGPSTGTNTEITEADLDKIIANTFQEA